MLHTKPPRIPSYRLYRRTGQAVVTIDGRDFYLGEHGTVASRQEYDRLVSEWLARGRRGAATGESTPGITIVELIAAYCSHAREYYIKGEAPTSEQDCIKMAVRPLRDLYERTPVSEFGPLKLKAVRQRMIDAGWSRRYINAQIDRIRRMVKWAVENELASPDIYHGLQAVAGLRRGRSSARETEPVKPVSVTDVMAVKPFVSRPVWGLIQVQLLTGCRPGEATVMRGCDLDTSGPVWVYTPLTHKTEHHGKKRSIYLGPKAQAIVKPFLRADLEAFLFSPAAAEEARNTQKRRKRRTPMTPSHRRRAETSRARSRRRPPGDHYTTDTYRRAIERACQQAFPAPEGLSEPEYKAWRRTHSWHPHQLRHTAATQLRRQFGIEAARVVLGHSSPTMTDLYAEIDTTKAIEVMARIG